MYVLGDQASAATVATQSADQTQAAVAAQLASLAQAQHRVGGAIASDTITPAEMQAALIAFLNPASGIPPTDYERSIARAIVSGGAMPSRPSTASQFGLSDDDYNALIGPPSNLHDSDIQQLINSGQLTDYLAHLRGVVAATAQDAATAAAAAFVPTTADEWWKKHGNGPRMYTVNGTTGDLFVMQYPITPADHSPALDAAYQQALAAQNARTAAQVNYVSPTVVQIPTATVPSSSTPTTTNTSGVPTPTGPAATSNYPVTPPPPAMPSDVAARSIPDVYLAPPSSGGISTGWLIAGAVSVLGIGAVLVSRKKRR